MLGDLFTVFDYGMGANAGVFVVYKWCTGMVLPIYLLCFSTYWYSPSWLESVLSSFMKLFMIKLPTEVKYYPGSVHLFFTLLIIVMLITVSGTGPLHYPLSSQFIIVGSLALPFWLATVFMNVNITWPFAFLKMVYKGNFLIPASMIVLSEVVSFLARPLTLTCRLVMNSIVGQIAIFFISNLCVAMFFPNFFIHGFSFDSLGMALGSLGNAGADSLGLSVVEASGPKTGGSGGGEGYLASPSAMVSALISQFSNFFSSMIHFTLVQFILVLLGGVIFFVEVSLMIVQAFIFTGLMVFYLYEVPLKLNEKMGLK